MALQPDDPQGLTTIYVWMRRGRGNLGIFSIGGFSLSHTSIGLPDGTYISHRPKQWIKRKTNKITTWKKKKRTPSLADDIKAEGGAPIKFTQEQLDHAAIKKWWQSYKESSRYRSVSNNCADVVNEALVRGGYEEILARMSL